MGKISHKYDGLLDSDVDYTGCYDCGDDAASAVVEFDEEMFCEECIVGRLECRIDELESEIDKCKEHIASTNITTSIYSEK